MESNALVAFGDLHPSADTHILIVPKKHIKSVRELKKEDGELLAEIYQAVNSLVNQYNLTEDSYRVVVNGGKAQHVPHIHFHLLGGNWYGKV